jgi:hypothetical protein
MSFGATIFIFTLFTGLYSSSSFATEIVENAVLENSAIVNAIDHDDSKLVLDWIASGHSPLAKIKNKIHEGFLERAAAHASLHSFEILIRAAYSGDSQAKISDSRGTPLLLTLSSLAIPNKRSTQIYERMIALVISISPDSAKAKDHAYIGDGRTALHQASSVGNIWVVKLLIAHGADVNAKNSIGETSLHLASRFGHLEAAQFLIASGALINAKTKFTRTTPLMAAAEMGHENIIRLLLASGAERNIKDAFGKTAPERFHEYCRIYATSVKRRNST